MKRNNEGRARQKIICTYHLDKWGQRDLDNHVKNKGLSFVDFMVLIKAGAYMPFLASNAFRRIGKKLSPVTAGVDTVITCGVINAETRQCTVAYLCDVAQKGG